jgi:hypothetical protein
MSQTPSGVGSRGDLPRPTTFDRDRAVVKASRPKTSSDSPSPGPAGNPELRQNQLIAVVVTNPGPGQNSPLTRTV